MGREVGSGRGRHYLRVSLVGGRAETRSYKIVSLPKPRGRRDLSVAVAEAKNGSWEQNDEGGKENRDNK